MKFKKVLAGFAAAALAVSSLSLVSWAEEEMTESYINLKGNTRYWAMNINYAPKTMIKTGTDTYALSVKNEAGYGDDFTSGEDGSGALEIRVYDVDENLTDIELVSVSVNGVEKEIGETTAQKAEWMYDATVEPDENGSQNGSHWGYTITLTQEQLDAVGRIEPGETLTVNVKATYPVEGDEPVIPDDPDEKTIESYINLKGNTRYWAMNINYAPKTMIETGTNTYALSVTNEAGYGDDFTSGEDGSGALEIRVYDVDENLTDIELVSVSVNGVEKEIGETTAQKAEWMYDATVEPDENGSQNGSHWGYTITLTQEQLDAIGRIEPGETLTVNVKATYPAEDEPVIPDDPGDDKEIVISEDETVLVSDWSVFIQILNNKLEGIKEGDVLKIYVKDHGENPQIQLKSTDDWSWLPGQAANGDDWSGGTGTEYGYNLSKDGRLLDVIEFTFTAADLSRFANGEDLIIGGKDVTITKVALVPKSAGGETPPVTSGSESETTPPPASSGNFVVPGGSSEVTTAADDTSAPADNTTAADNKPADTTADNKPADGTTANGDDSSSAPASSAPEADTQAPAATECSVNGDGNNADKNQNTGFALALIPAMAAAAGVIISKKRK